MRAIVTGGCRGLGLSFSNYLNSLGYEVYALYNESEKLNNIKSLKCNLKNEDEIKNAFNEIGEFDLLINNAAISLDNDYLNKSKSEFMEVLEVNLVGNFLMTKYAIEKLNDNGIIINISSNNALDCYNPISMDYDASKAGVNILTKDFSLVLNQLNKNQKIISICPGWINTDTIKESNPDFIKDELIRNKQSKLIEPDELVKEIIDNLDNYSNGKIIEIKEI